jgi:hypothetical protein
LSAKKVSGKGYISHAAHFDDKEQRMGPNNNNPRRGGSLLVACTAAIGTVAPDVDRALAGGNRMETCRVPSVFLDLLVSGVLAPSRRLAGDR